MVGEKVYLSGGCEDFEDRNRAQIINAMVQQEKEKIEELAKNMTESEMLVVLSAIPVSFIIDVLKERIESDQSKLDAVRNALN